MCSFFVDILHWFFCIICSHSYLFISLSQCFDQKKLFALNVLIMPTWFSSSKEHVTRDSDFKSLVILIERNAKRILHEMQSFVWSNQVRKLIVFFRILETAIQMMAKLNINNINGMLVHVGLWLLSVCAILYGCWDWIENMESKNKEMIESKRKWNLAH